MPLVLSTPARERAEAIHAPAPVVSLWRFVVDVQTSATTVADFTPYPLPVHYLGRTYSPFPMSWGGFEVDAEANLPTTIVNLTNVRRDLAHYLHQGSGFIGNAVNVKIVPLDMVGRHDVQDAEVYDLRVAGASIDHSTIKLNVALPSFYLRMFPEQRYNAELCRFRFGLPTGGCPYRLGPRAAYSDCNKLTTDCTDRGADMRARGYPDLLPSRIGAFVGSVRRSG